MALSVWTSFLPLLLSTAIALYFLQINQSRTPSIEDPIAIDKVLLQAQGLSSHSWEYAVAAQAALELYNPEISVFASNPFPNDRLPIPDAPSVSALRYIQPLIYTNESELQSSPATIGDPPALGPFALLIGQSDPIYLSAAERQLDHILESATRWSNGAISHWRTHPELWADFIYMTPPFLAYAAVAFNNITLMYEAYQQIKLYREVLLQAPNTTVFNCPPGLWIHIAGPQNPDPGFWSTSNGWAVAGMLRVYAIMSSWTPSSSTMNLELSSLESWILDLLSAIICIDTTDPTRTDPSDNTSPLLRNYITDPLYFRETSGTSLIASSVYRAAVILHPSSIPDSWIHWAESKRRAVFSSHCLNNETGVIGPSVNALDHFDRTSLWEGSAEGESFGVLLWAGWKDFSERRGGIKEIGC